MKKLLDNLLSAREALLRIKKHVKLDLNCEYVGVRECIGRVSCRDYEAPVNIPPYDRSAVDGYAVRAEDTYGASPTSPVELRIVSKNELASGEAVEIATGAPIPKGADAVVMYEDCIRRGDILLVNKPCFKWSNVSRVGEDFKAGDKVVTKGEELKPWHAASLASFGYGKVCVYRRIKVAVLVTGGEVVEPSDKPGEIAEGLVYNSTGTLVYTYLSQYKILDVSYAGIVCDDKNEVKKRILELLEENDCIITTGGTGVSGRDIVPEAVNEIGSPGVIVRGVAIRPGRPTSIGVVKGKPIFMLSGLPVAALAGLESIVLPSLYSFLQSRYRHTCVVKAKLARRLANAIGFESYFRVFVYEKNGEYYAEPLRLTGSGILSTLIKGNGILIVPSNIEGYEAGDTVEIVLLNPIPKL